MPQNKWHTLYALYVPIVTCKVPGYFYVMHDQYVTSDNVHQPHQSMIVLDDLNFYVANFSQPCAENACTPLNCVGKIDAPTIQLPNLM